MSAENLPPAVSSYLDQVADPFTIAKTLDNSEGDYLARYTELFERIFADVDSQQARAIRAFLDQIDDGCLVEESARQAGFVLGFEYAKRLLAVPAGGAR